MTPRTSVTRNGRTAIRLSAKLWSMVGQSPPTGWRRAVHRIADVVLPAEYRAMATIDSKDGGVWAREFCRLARILHRVELDEAWVTGWFANALEAGRRREQADDFLRGLQ